MMSEDRSNDFRRAQQTHLQTCRQLLARLRPFCEAQTASVHDVLTTINLVIETTWANQAETCANGPWVTRRVGAAVVATVQRYLDELSPQVKSSVRVLAEHGWYPDPDLTPKAVVALAHYIARGDFGTASDLLCEHFDSIVDSIEALTTASLPDRAAILCQALAAHRRADYALSVPVLLAQTEGLYQDTFVTRLYVAGKKRSLTQVSRRIGGFVAAVFAALTQCRTGCGAPDGAPKDCSPLDRNAIMHGESLDYDTRSSSCQALSLFWFVCWVQNAALDRDRQSAPAANQERAAHRAEGVTSDGPDSCPDA